MAKRLDEIHCKGIYVQECDMKECEEVICDSCGVRVLHELCDDEGIKVMRDKLRKPEIGEQFARVCQECEIKLNKLGVPTDRPYRTSLITVIKNGEVKRVISTGGRTMTIDKFPLKDLKY